MTKPKTRDCQECVNFAHDKIDSKETGDLCACGHRPRFYTPRSPMPLPHEWGWKRRCDDFKPTGDADGLGHAVKNAELLMKLN